MALSDTLVSILAGISIFPAVFSFGMKPEAGPGLLFMTLPMVFSRIPFGNVLLVAFFVLASIAATTAMLSLVEVPVAYFSEEKGVSRTKAVLINALIIIVFGIPAALSADKNSILGQMTFFGKTYFDLVDYLSSNIILPIGGLLIALFAGYMTRKEKLAEELSNRGTLDNSRVVDVFYFIVRYVTPGLLLIVFLNSIGVIKI